MAAFYRLSGHKEVHPVLNLNFFLNRNLTRFAAGFEANHGVVGRDTNQCGNLLSGHFGLYTIAFFELDVPPYSPKPSYQFYDSYRRVINAMKGEVSLTFSGGNPEFQGFLMMACDL